MKCGRSLTAGKQTASLRVTWIFAGGLRVEMNRPSLDELLPKVDSRYTLVVTAARRARQITDGSPPAVATRSDKPVTIALYEILHGKVVAKRPGRGSG